MAWSTPVSSISDELLPHNNLACWLLTSSVLFQLITQREAVSSRIRQSLVERARDFHLILDDVSITHLSFGKEYTAAVEAKQVAQQEAERARFIVDKAVQEKKSMVIKAEGEAKSATLIGSAIRDNPGFIELRKLEAARDIASLLCE